MKKVMLIFLIAPILSFGQSKKIQKILKKNLTMNVRGFDSSQPISVEIIRNDEMDTEGNFENALFSYGFDVISNRTAEVIKSIGNPLDLKNQDIKIRKYSNYKSVYVLTLSSQSRADTGCGGRVPSNLTGRIVDLFDEGSLVGTFRFKQGNFEGKCMSDVAEAIAYKLSSMK